MALQWDLFKASKSMTVKTLIHVVRELVVHLYDGFFKMPEGLVIE